jgi:DNA repair exonuclease SbcCD ATPase subunit
MVSKLLFLGWTVTDKTSGKMLNCNVHSCPSRCHQLQDHSKMECKAVIASVCPNGHKVTRECHDKAAAICRKCEAVARAAEKRRERDHKLDQERSIKQEAYARKLAEIEDEIEHEKRLSKNRAEEADRQNAILQKKQDLANLKARNSKALPNAAAANPSAPINKTGGDTLESRTSSSSPPQSMSSSDGNANNSGTTPSEPEPSSSDWSISDAKEDWDRQKQCEGAENEAMDSLMAMIGQFKRSRFDAFS